MQFIVYSSIMLMMESWLLYIGLPKYFNQRELKKRVKDFEKNFLPDTERTLYIIGNGFDIYHGIKSKYTDFKHYLYCNNRKVYDLFEKYYEYDSYELQKKLNEKKISRNEWQDKRIEIINGLVEELLWSNWETSLGKLKLSYADEFLEWGMDWADYGDGYEKRLMDLENSRNYRDKLQK